MTAALITQIVALELYKVASLACGSAMCFLGYRLFVLGIVTKAGDMTAGYGKWRLGLKSAAPGTFFAVLGAVVLLGTIAKGFQATVNPGFMAGSRELVSVPAPPLLDLPAPTSSAPSSPSKDPPK